MAEPRRFRLDRRLIHGLTCLVVALGVVLPLRWPVSIQPATRRAYALADAIRPGQAAFLVIDYGFGAQPELDPVLTAVVAHLMRRGALLVFTARTVEGSQIAQDVVTSLARRFPAYRAGYGRTWVNLGYRPAGDVPLRAATRNLAAAYNDTDYAGRSLRRLPLLARVPAVDAAHFRLAYVFDSADGFAAMMNYVTQPTGLPLVVGAIASEVPVIQPFVASRQIAAVVRGIRGAAEYEELVGHPAEGMRAQTTLALVAAYVTLLIALGNAEYLLARRRRA